ncbi:MAG: histidinol dehydrogenase [Anaerotruncus massiliensis (ex Togo et al. 2019)]
MGQRVRGLSRVGLYVPGGTAAYPSSVLMNCIPARIAGVGEIVMVTPPRKDGTANPDILAAAAVAGVDRVFLMGGAQAVAALAYGTASVPRVDKIVGPGNIYVATAKRLLYGTVDIDMIAGPSEILIAADDTANPVYLAADMMSQAEHDVLASSVLLTTSERVAEETAAELSRQVESLSRAGIIRQSLADYGMIIVCRSEAEMIALANELAPEHMEIMTANPLEYIGKIDNVGSSSGAAFARTAGDYLPAPITSCRPPAPRGSFTARGGQLLKRSSFLYYTREALAEAQVPIVRLADKEGLTAHANSVKVRFPDVW